MRRGGLDLRLRDGLDDVGPSVDGVRALLRLEQDHRWLARHGTGTRHRPAAASCARGVRRRGPSPGRSALTGSAFEPRWRSGPVSGTQLRSRISTSPSMTSANSSCGAVRHSDVPSARIVSTTYWRFLPTATFSYGLGLYGDLEHVGECVSFRVVIDDVDRRPSGNRRVTRTASCRSVIDLASASSSTRTVRWLNGTRADRGREAIRHCVRSANGCTLGAHEYRAREERVKTHDRSRVTDRGRRDRARRRAVEPKRACAVVRAWAAVLRAFDAHAPR